MSELTTYLAGLRGELPESVNKVDEAQLKKDLVAIFTAFKRNKVKAGKSALKALEDVAFDGYVKDEKVNISSDTKQLIKWALLEESFKRPMLIKLRFMNKSPFYLKEAAMFMLHELPRYWGGGGRKE